MSVIGDIFSRDLKSATLRLDEAVNYDEMFNDVKKFCAALEVNDPSPFIKTAIATARKTLKKNDRVVWFLRLYKLQLTHDVTDKALKMGKTEEANALRQRVYGDYARKAKSDINQVAREASWLDVQRLIPKFEHFLSLPIPAIQNKVFTFEGPETILEQFHEIEDEWKAEQDDAFQEDDPGVEPIIEFKNGFAWYNLNKAYCRKEAGAMGHCGNAPRQHSSDTILSLRKAQQRGDVTLTTPFLTFILDDNGYLGEMKGRANEKPQARYHPYIIELLKNPIVQGIKGGGYMPENNFSMDDLDHDVAEQLIEMKPELGGLRYVVKKYGLEDKRSISLLNEKCRANNVSYYGFSDDHKQVILEKWGDLSQFLRDVDDTMVLKMLNYLDDEPDEEVVETVEDISEESLFEMVERMETSSYNALCRRLGVQPVAHNAPNFHQFARRLADLLKTSEFEDELVEAFNKAFGGSSRFKEAVRERLNEYLDEGWPFELYNVWLKFDKEDFDADVFLMMDTGDFIDIISSDDDEDSEDGWQLRRAQDEGWYAIDGYNAKDSRKERGMVWGRYDVELSSDPVLKKIMGGKDDVAVDPHLAARYFAKAAGL